MAAAKKPKPVAYTAGLHSAPIILKPGMAHAGVPSQFKGSPSGKGGWKSTYHPVKPTPKKKS
jgi:hypothetical protein